MDLLFKNPQYFFDTYFNIPLWLFLSAWLVNFGIFRMIEWRLAIQKRRQEWWDALCAFVISGVMTVCLLNKSRANGRRLIWNPSQIFLKLFTGDVHTIRQLSSNIFLFIPVGLIFRLRWNTMESVGMGLALSAFVEVLQYCFGVGTTEVADLLLNTIGTLIGAAIIFGYKRIKGRLNR